MHESSLARQILALSLAAARPGAIVLVIRGRVAETETLSRDAIELNFRAQARGTPAADARLELVLVHVEARCRACGVHYLPEHHVLVCMACGSTEGEELGPRGLWLESIDVSGGAP